MSRSFSVNRCKKWERDGIGFTGSGSRKLIVQCPSDSIRKHCPKTVSNARSKTWIYFLAAIGPIPCHSSLTQVRSRATDPGLLESTRLFEWALRMGEKTLTEARKSKKDITGMVAPAPNGQPYQSFILIPFSRRNPPGSTRTRREGLPLRQTAKVKRESRSGQDSAHTAKERKLELESCCRELIALAVTVGSSMLLASCFS